MAFRRQHQMVLSSLARWHVPAELQNSVSHHLLQQWESNGGRDTATVFNDIPDALRTEVGSVSTTSAVVARIGVCLGIMTDTR
jgi:hypothetical protein